MARVGVIVLAAGRSTRFAEGRASKLLTPLHGTAIVRHAAAAAVEADVGEVVVVTGDRATEVADAIAGLPVRIVYEPTFADGMAASLASGIRASVACDAVMIGLGDVPGARPDAYRAVAARWRESGSAIVVPRYAGSPHPSHPTLFAATVFGELLALQGDVGARDVVARDASRVAEAPLDWAAPDDIDTLEDLDRLGALAPRDTSRESSSRSLR